MYFGNDFTFGVIVNFDLNKTIPGCRSFIWHEALWLPQWQCHVCPTDKQEDEIINIAYKAQQIRDFFGLPLVITSWLRPKLYNELVNGAEKSQHVYGKAIDFKVRGLSCDEVRVRLEPKLEELKIRMERADDQDRVHIDNGDVIKSRYFYRE